MACSICGQPAHCRGWCRIHYSRWRKWGDPLYLARKRRYSSLAEYIADNHTKDPSGCWLWTGTVSHYGYGVSQFTKYPRMHAHRAMYELTHGKIPNEKVLVCHKCDNRLCINPDHLFLGSHDDNQKDMARKGRAARGERNAGAKLTSQQVLAIRADTRRPEEIARDFGITENYVCQIRRRERWTHL